MSGANSIYNAAYIAAGSGLFNTVYYKVTKRDVPTVTRFGTWSVTNCAQPSAGGASINSCYIGAAATGAGTVDFHPDSADDYIEVKSEL